MRIFTFSFLFTLAVTTVCFAQNGVIDTHPNASIYAIDYQSNQEVLATEDAAILFKDAFIDLVINTPAAMQYARGLPGHKSFIIKQVDPKITNGYQLTLETKFLGQTATVYTFLYKIDENTLYYYDKNQQNWEPELIQGNNVVKLNMCLQYSNFNEPVSQQAPDLSLNAQSQADTTADDTPVDDNVTATVQPPALPEYQQPECPVDGYLWQPGYWAYSLDSDGYYWVPGVWVAPPSAGYLWTPPYWGYNGIRFVFYRGYWGTSIGFYGGINYGYGYGGSGYYGGEWREGRYHYNTAVVRVNTVVVHNTYVNTTVINNTVINNNRTSFNGRGGVTARPTPQEVQATHEKHIMATPDQIRNQRVARGDRSQFAAANGGKPTNLAAEKAPARPVNTNQPNNRPVNGAANNGRQGFNGANNTRLGGNGTTQNNAPVRTNAPAQTGFQGNPASNNGNAPATNRQQGRENIPGGTPGQNTPAQTGNRNGTPASTTEQNPPVQTGGNRAGAPTPNRTPQEQQPAARTTAPAVNPNQQQQGSRSGFPSPNNSRPATQQQNGQRGANRQQQQQRPKANTRPEKTDEKVHQ